ncbi:phage tail protein [Pseudomonas putida]|uniref:phage tail protein n=1 Tax=Pseudomonas putida TaxID=303 RepID=UPI000A73E78B|nr:phage tail protein [Pseudomonas putida]
MTTANSQFFAILTAVGEAKQANANALGVPWTISAMGVGDANGADPIPSRTQTQLINERRRAPLNQLKVDPSNSSVIIAEQVIPPDEGGWWIREIGLYDEASNLVAVANCAPSFKPLLSQGTGKTQVVRLNIIVSSTANVVLKIDPSVVLATREYVDSRIFEVLPATRPAGTYTKVTVDVRGVVIAGQNPSTLSDYGITDAYTKSQVDTALLGKANKANTLAGYGILDAFTQDQVTSRLSSKADKATSLAGYGIGNAFTQDEVSQLLSGKAGKATSLAGYGIADAYTKTQTDAALSGKADKATSLGGYGIADAYTKTQTDAALSGKADKATSLGGYGIADAYTKIQTDTALAGKAGKATSLAGYGITDAFTQDQVTLRLSSKADKATSLAGYGIGNAFTQDEVISRLVGVAQTLQDMTASRALNTIFRNSDTKPILVRVSAIVSGVNGSGAFNATVAGAGGYSATLLGGSGYGAGSSFVNEFLVGPGEDYSVVFSGTAYSSLSWKERRA